VRWEAGGACPPRLATKRRSGKKFLARGFCRLFSCAYQPAARAGIAFWKKHLSLLRTLTF